MTLPNKITVARLVFTPVFFAWFFITMYYAILKPEITPILAIILFLFWIALEVSDVIDGHIARKHNLVSDMGKLLDPFSDVIARLTFFYCLVTYNFLPSWPFIIILWREFTQTFLRAVMAMNGIVVPASQGGKIKALFYFLTSFIGMLFIVILLCFPNTSSEFLDNMLSFNYIVFVITMLASVISFIEYLRNFLKTDFAKKFISE